MRITILKSIIAFIFILNAPFARAEHYPVKKEKKVSKLYNVNADAGISIKNKYGNVYVTTWDESQIAIDVVITVEGKNENDVQKKIDNINIEFDAAKALISAKTVFGNSATNNANVQVNYTVKFPKKGSAVLDNQYGSITADKIFGSSTIECHYGNVTIGDLMNDNNTLRLKYCDKSVINYARSITVDSQYSGLKLKKAGNVTYKGDYSSLNSNEIDNLVYAGDYGELSLTQVGNMTLRGDYIQTKLLKLDGNLTVNTDYATLFVGGISAKTNNIAINSSYTEIELKYDSEYAFDFDFNLKYTDMKSSGLTFQTRKENITSSVYKGFNKTAGKNKLSVTCEYGNLKLTKI